ncbi:LysM peptidoglycan-binding domain-containing protein [Deinococcus altitudinis]|uniref:LysM peptidoglycan-binding domain-containing protein n=1 Tax=Deinococcus altitudinis TaxID=468914 RepID=UPI003891D426
MTSLTIRSALLTAATFLMSALLSLAPASAAQYTVRSGDTLFSIARTHGTDAQALLKLNTLGSPTLNVGQVLQVPYAAASKPAAALGSAAPASPAARAAAAVASTVSRMPAGLPSLSAGGVRGPVAWSVTPQPTVASFIGYLPSIATTAFGNMLPIRTYLQGLAFDHQTYNNCGPSALSSVLGFYKAQVSQDAIRRATRPSGGYMQVSAIAPELGKYGLKTLTIRNGRLDQVKRLLSLGIPVIVLQWYDRPGHIDHFRVVRGYDDQAGLVWVSDSMIGPVAYLSYASFDALWNTQGRQMFPVYPKGFDGAVKALL